MKKLFIIMILGLSCYAVGLQPVRSEMVFGPDSETPGTRLDAIVAIVNDDIITRRELDTAINTVERQIQQHKAPTPARAELEQQVLERLILGKLQLREAERNGIVVDDPTLNATLENLARQNNLTLSQLRETAEKDGLSFADFREEIRRGILFTRLRQRLVDSHIQISDEEVNNALASPASAATGSTEYHIAHILIAIPEGATPEQIETAQKKAQGVLEQLHQGADFKQLAVTVSNDRQALEGGDLGWRTAEQLPGLFGDVVPRLKPGQVSDLIRSPSGFHIIKLLEVRGSSPASPVTTQAHIRHILIKTTETVSDTEAQQRLQRLYERIQQGQDFAEIARAHSEDSVSAPQGGDLGWLTPTKVPPEFAAELDKLQPGDVSRPFKTRFGWHIVQLVERRQSQDSEETQRDKIREALFKRRVDEEWDMRLRRLRDEAYVEIRLPKANTDQ
jgi:peptidyl-prolyl cis-trans isomerase SurA